MKMIPVVLSILITCQVLLFCAAPKTFVSFADWDASSNSKIERAEFVDAYTAQGYFEKWGQSQSIGYPQLYDVLFESLDTDKNLAVSSEEFNAQIKLFYFGLFNGSFEGWDDNKDGSLSKNEFAAHAASSNLTSLWDNDGDKRISEREMAGGMFYLADANGDGAVDATELEAWKKNR